MIADTLTSYSQPVTSLDVDEQFIYTVSASTIRVWEKDSLACAREAVKGMALRLCVDERYVYTTDFYRFSVLDKDTLQPVYRRQFGYDASSDLGGVLQDREHVYFPIRGGRLVVVDKSDFDRAREFKEHEGSIWGMDADEEFLYTCGVDQMARVWEKHTFKVVRVLVGHKSNVQRVRASERCIVTGSADRSAIIYDKASGTPLHHLRRAHTKAVNGLLLWQNYLMTSSNADGTPKIWDLETGRLLKELAMCVQAGSGVIDGGRVLLPLRQPPGVKIVALEDLFCFG